MLDFCKDHTGILVDSSKDYAIIMIDLLRIMLENFTIYALLTKQCRKTFRAFFVG